MIDYLRYISTMHISAHVKSILVLFEEAPPPIALEGCVLWTDMASFNCATNHPWRHQNVCQFYYDRHMTISRGIPVCSSAQ